MSCCGYLRFINSFFISFYRILYFLTTRTWHNRIATKETIIIICFILARSRLKIDWRFRRCCRWDLWKNFIGQIRWRKNDKRPHTSHERICKDIFVKWTPKDSQICFFQICIANKWSIVKWARGGLIRLYCVCGVNYLIGSVGEKLRSA